MSEKHVLLIGLKPEVVDFKQWPDLSVEKLNASFKEVLSQLQALGFVGEWCLTDLGDTALETVKTKLANRHYAIIVIGAGLRKHPDLLLLFEALINLIQEYSPGSKICFNSNPMDTVAAVQRWA